MRSSNFEKQGKTEIGMQLVTRLPFLFLKIGITRAIFSLSGKTPFAKEVLNICFRITNISSSFFFAFDSTEARTVVVNLVLECRFVFENGGR